jgi:hypothetical protein
MATTIRRVLRVTPPRGPATRNSSIIPPGQRLAQELAGSSAITPPDMPSSLVARMVVRGFTQGSTLNATTPNTGSIMLSASRATMKRLSDPERVRSLAYLAHVRSKPCLTCGGHSDAHHLTHAQPRAMARKTGDQYAVPLCRKHHMELHESPMPERTWWALQGIDPIRWAEKEYSNWTHDHVEHP